VNRLLADIQPLWDKPITALGDEAEPLDAAIARVSEIDGYLARYPGDHPPALSRQSVLADFAQWVRLACAPKGAAQVLAYNAGLRYPSALEKEQLRILNDYRMLLGINPLEMDVRLYLAARDHSRAMEERGFFSHDSPLPGMKSFTDRAKAAGYGAAKSENIARGQRSAAQVHAGWFSSSGHHANMVGGHSQIGVGESGFFWTQVFGSGSLLSRGKAPKTVAVLIEVLSLPADATPDERFRVAQLAAGAKQWQEAKAPLELVLKAEPGNAKAQKAYDKVLEQIRN
jgi:hypothetical protein